MTLPSLGVVRNFLAGIRVLGVVVWFQGVGAFELSLPQFLPKFTTGDQRVCRPGVINLVFESGVSTKGSLRPVSGLSRFFCFFSSRKARQQFIMVGDQKQLPPVVLCQAAEEKGPGSGGGK